jgi:6-phosphogluconolactonase
MKIYIGTYTDGGTCFAGACGDGIMSCQFDSQSGCFSQLNRSAAVENPSWLHLADDGKHLFAVSELFESSGEVHGFDVDGVGDLIHSSTQSSHGLATCHLTTTENHLYAASYLDGRLSSCARQGGQIEEALEVIQYAGTGPNGERQECAHAHQAVLSPDGRWLYVCDLGSDCIRLHTLRAGIPVHLGDIDLAPGSGPRHLVFHASRPLAWVVCELIPRIVTLVWDATSGELRPLHSIDLDIDPECKGIGATAAIRLHPSGRVLGISERATHSICLFSVGESGELTFQQRIQSQEQTPRDFAFTPDGRWLIAAYQDTHALVSFGISADLKVASAPASRLKVNSPVCLLT